MSDVPHPHDYERSDADIRLVAALAIGIAAFLAMTPFLLDAGYPGADQSGGVPHGLPAPPQPRLQTQPKIDLERLRADERGKLQTFGWADRDAGVVRIPIERAMQLLAERGLAGWPSTPKNQPEPH